MVEDLILNRDELSRLFSTTKCCQNDNVKEESYLLEEFAKYTDEGLVLSKVVLTQKVHIITISLNVDNNTYSYHYLRHTYMYDEIFYDELYTNNKIIKGSDYRALNMDILERRTNNSTNRNIQKYLKNLVFSDKALNDMVIISYLDYVTESLQIHLDMEKYKLKY